MKNLLIGILAITSVVFGTLAFKGNQKQKEAEATVASLRETVSETQSRLEAQEKQTTSLQNNLLETRTESAVKATEAAQLKVALTNETQAASSASASNKPSPLAEMFKNKEMRDMIATQQKMVLGPMIEKNYASFFSSIGLKSDQAAGLKDLMVKRALVDAQTGTSIMAGDVDADQRKQMLQQAKDEKDGIDAQIKQFLGDDNYAQFKDYEKVMPERTAVSGFKDQLASGPNALSDDQAGSLIKALSEERQNFKFTTDFYDKSKYDYNDLGSMFSDERINRFETEIAQLDQQYLSRAQSILSADQMTSFQKYLDSQNKLQSAGFKMAAHMFKK